ncbi:OmpA family protein [Neolewinella lacunae]|uniref:OmpA family protein n=1 Tax=Neolewinella lacunae TaxID=1517758 RepID=A0A923PJ91_9BACT|nr:OmpA family protein [Neolewinella lacunae]MBC6993590.1 OmpA family protein [Neolewinella lacunae]MDN3633478.1 OmpA family protein [Neolewinella lacunae]
MPKVILGILLFWSGSLLAQVTGYVDSVEVHRTDTIYFDFGSAALSAAASRAIAEMVSDRPAELSLYLEGHTDAVGSENANDLLARRRSESTLAAVLAAGWPPEAVEIRHFGERRLRISTQEREWRNRRVLLRSGLPRRYARFVGTITDADGVPLPGGVVAHGRHLRDTVRADADGRYTVYLPLDAPVRLDVYARDHFFTSHHLTLREDDPPETALVSQLASAAPGKRMAIPDLYFVGNRTDLLKESYPTLPRLLQFMRFSPELRIELAGHVNSPGLPQGPGSWEYRLAENRAKLVHDYLIHFGIEPHRVRYKSYSNLEMIHPNARGEQQMRVNRRVEIRVLEDGLK